MRTLAVPVSAVDEQHLTKRWVLQRPMLVIIANDFDLLHKLACCLRCGGQLDFAERGPVLNKMAHDLSRKYGKELGSVHKDSIRTAENPC